MDWSPYKDLLAGLAGSFAAAHFQKNIDTKRDYVVFIVSGTLIAKYLTDFVIAYLKFDPTMTGGVSFLLGAFGGSLMQAILKAIQNADIWGVIRGRFGGDTKP